MGAVRVRAQISLFFFPLPDSLFVLFFLSEVFLGIAVNSSRFGKNRERVGGGKKSAKFWRSGEGGPAEERSSGGESGGGWSGDCPAEKGPAEGRSCRGTVRLKNGKIHPSSKKKKTMKKKQKIKI